MKICRQHWERLRQLIDENGLSQFVAKNDEEAAARLRKKQMVK